MFATIETNGATHIAIHIPREGADKTLPALAALLEKNAVFIKQGYQELTTVKPAMNILLGNTFRLEQYGLEVELQVPESDAAPSPDFVIASPEVFTSNAKALAKKAEELSAVRKELDYVKSENERMKRQVEEIANPASA